MATLRKRRNIKSTSSISNAAKIIKSSNTLKATKVVQQVVLATLSDNLSSGLVDDPVVDYSFDNGQAINKDPEYNGIVRSCISKNVTLTNKY